MTSSCSPEIFGADPANIKWRIVRGDTSPLRVEFFENDEVTPYDTEGWEYSSTTYDFRGDVLDELEVEAGEGFVNITAPAEITSLWGTGYSSVVTELAFDLQVTIDGDTVWTPVIGTITVLGDVTGGSL
jgi:hypothetical protein